MADIVLESIAPLLSSVWELLYRQWGVRGSEFWRPPNTIKESVIFWFEIVRSKFWYGTKGHTPVFVPPLSVLVNGQSIKHKILCQATAQNGGQSNHH